MVRLTEEERRHLVSLNLKPGDWISNVMGIFLNPGYRHHSIYIGYNMVVGRVQSGVVKQGIWELSRIKTVRVEQRGGYRQASNALLCVGHKGYSLLFNNCEQFSEKCHDKHFRLGQVGKATGGGGFGVGHAIECNKKSINAKPTSGGSATGGGGGGAVIGKTVALATGVAATTATVGYVAYKSTLAYLAYRVAIRFLW